MNTKMKGNNKGFSLVELIVVMAIIAILAVTLTPRLSHFVEKARITSDREVVSTYYTAVKYALLDNDIYSVVASDAEAADAAAGLGTGEVQLYDYNDDADATLTGFNIFSAMYPSSGGKNTIATITGTKDKFYDEIKSIVGDSVKLKSKDYSTSTILVLKITDQNTFSLTLDYDGNVSTTDDQYVLDSTK